MKPALEWINAVGEAVMTAAFAGAQPPGTEVEDIVKAIQADAATDATELARVRGELEEARVKVETAKAFAIKYAGHRLMLVAQPFRKLVNLLK